MKLQNRIEILGRLKEYLLENTAEWQEAKTQAYQKNGWFTPEFIDLSVNNIIEHFLQPDKMLAWANHYSLDDNNTYIFRVNVIV